MSSICHFQDTVSDVKATASLEMIKTLKTKSHYILLYPATLSNITLVQVLLCNTYVTVRNDNS